MRRHSTRGVHLKRKAPSEPAAPHRQRAQGALRAGPRAVRGAKIDGPDGRKVRFCRCSTAFLFLLATRRRAIAARGAGPELLEPGAMSFFPLVEDAVVESWQDTE